MKNAWLAGAVFVGLGLVALAAQTALPTAQDAAPPVAVNAGAMPPDAEIIAAGKHVWFEAACSNCHGDHGQGGESVDFPKGPSLRTSGLDPDAMLQIIKCGFPNTRMPAWGKGAYIEFACSGLPLGSPPSGTLVSGLYSEDDLKALVAYIQTSFMKQPMPQW